MTDNKWDRQIPKTKKNQTITNHSTNIVKQSIYIYILAKVCPPPFSVAYSDWVPIKKRK